MLWNATYETGIPIVDAQHKELFNQLDILMDKNQKDRVPATLDFLGKYVVKHFSTEEGLQTKVKYPKYPTHQQMHKAFVKAYTDLKSQYQKEGGSNMMTMKISQTALNWLKDHIRVHDKEFAAYYKGAMQQNPQSVRL